MPVERVTKPSSLVRDLVTPGMRLLESRPLDWFQIADMEVTFEGRSMLLRELVNDVRHEAMESRLG